MTDAGSQSDRPASDQVGSTWSINWRGAIGLVALGAVMLAAWLWLDGAGFGGDDDEVADGSRTTAASSTTLPVRPTTTVARTTTTTTRPRATTTTTSAPPGPRVDITGEMRPCRYGANCLVASFTIAGFDGTPGRFVCIYPNSRRDFAFDGEGKEDACLSGDEGDTIAIEVDGVVSNTISEANLAGTDP